MSDNTIKYAADKVIRKNGGVKNYSQLLNEMNEVNRDQIEPLFQGVSKEAFDSADEYLKKDNHSIRSKSMFYS